jgi:hypothetical protein
MMIAVAVVGLALGLGLEAARLRRVARDYRQKAARYAESERINVAFFEMNPYPGNGFLLETAAYWGQLKQKYAAAARRPWRSVPPDPRPPWESRPKPDGEFGWIKFPRSHVDLSRQAAQPHD